MEVHDLKQSIQALPQVPVAAKGTDSAQAPIQHQISSEGRLDEKEDVKRLEQQASSLAAEVAKLEKVRDENEKLRAQLAGPSANALTLEEEQALAKTREKVLSIECINHLKQFGLAVRTWALDNRDLTPPDVLSMSNELSTPVVLFCPADTNRLSVKSWSSFSAANCSYEYLAPSSPDGREPTRVLSQCPIHGHIGLMDGSVQMSVARNHPEWLVQRDGKLFLENPNNPGPSPARATPGDQKP